MALGGVTMGERHTVAICLEHEAFGYTLGCEAIMDATDESLKMVLQTARAMAKEKSLAISFLLGSAHN